MEQTEETFRDHIATVDEEGKRVWMYPKKPNGKFYNRRKIVSYILLILLFGIPHVKVAGNPLLLFNILDRKFIIFGQVFWPQDFHIFAIGMIAFVIFIALFTVIYGRLFCGWVCPQTVFMEMVFRRIEYWIEGDGTHQRQLDKAPWDGKKILKKVSKHAIFWLISFFIANTFLAYIIGAEELWHIQIDDPRNHIGGLVAIVIFTTVFYLVFAKLREQVCTTICPYGRLQGVLLDRKSIVVAYDHIRGEERGKFKKNEDRSAVGKGDCIDCHQCVDVCPTGIDIRNGTQLECVNCTACIDACDFMMDKVGMDTGLIRYVSEDGIVANERFKWTPRRMGYSAVLIILIGVLAVMTITRSDFEATVMRERGSLYQKVDKEHISNIYDIVITNKTTKDYEVTLKLLEGKGTIQLVGGIIHLEKEKETKGRFVIIMERADVSRGKNTLKIGVFGNDQLIETVKTTFVGPLI